MTREQYIASLAPDVRREAEAGRRAVSECLCRSQACPGWTFGPLQPPTPRTPQRAKLVEAAKEALLVLAQADGVSINRHFIMRASVVRDHLHAAIQTEEGAYRD